METKTLITRLMYYSVGLAGLMTAIIILISPDGDAVGNGIATAFLIFLADGIILASLLSKHEWLKIGTWIAAIYSLIIAVIYTWTPRTIENVAYGPARGDSGYSYEPNYNGYAPEYQSGVMTNPGYETLGDLTKGGYIIAFTFVFAVLFSRFYTIISVNDKIMSYSYRVALRLGLASGLIIGLAASIDNEELLLRFGFALLFLAFTAAVITGIAYIVKETKESNERKAENIRLQEEHMKMYPNGYRNAPVMHDQSQMHYGNQQQAPYVNQTQASAYGQSAYNQQPHNVPPYASQSTPVNHYTEQMNPVAPDVPSNPVQSTNTDSTQTDVNKMNEDTTPIQHSTQSAPESSTTSFDSGSSSTDNNSM